MDDEVDTDRAVVQTYVPNYQKDEWKRHAERFDMSQSEFVRTMVQAGRRGFGGDDDVGPSASPPEDEMPSEGSGGPSAGEVREHVVAALSEADALDWEALIDRVTAHVETEVEGVLEELQAENEVRYSGPMGGYTLVEDR